VILAKINLINIIKDQNIMYIDKIFLLLIKQLQRLDFLQKDTVIVIYFKPNILPEKPIVQFFHIASEIQKKKIDNSC